MGKRVVGENGINMSHVSAADKDVDLARYIALHERKEELKVQSKHLNAEFKELTSRIHEYLLHEPGNACHCPNTKYAVRIQPKTKTGSLNQALIGEGYVAYQRARGNSTVTVDERDSFLSLLKELRKTKKEVVHDVAVIVPNK
tara:strand:- start:224 stop:652 length:429 start_codon:yes stop_codon:yes gene_type:complete